MKAILEFKLPEDCCEYDNATHGGGYASIISELLNWLRDQYKYEAGEISVEDAEAVRDKIVDLFSDYEIPVP
jgi:hypothetical protein